MSTHKTRKLDIFVGRTTADAVQMASASACLIEKPPSATVSTLFAAISGCLPNYFDHCFDLFLATKIRSNIMAFTFDFGEFLNHSTFRLALNSFAYYRGLLITWHSILQLAKNYGRRHIKNQSFWVAPCIASHNAIVEAVQVLHVSFQKSGYCICSYTGSYPTSLTHHNSLDGYHKHSGLYMDKIWSLCDVHVWTWAKYAFKLFPRWPIEVECVAHQKGFIKVVLYSLFSILIRTRSEHVVSQSEEPPAVISTVNWGSSFCSQVNRAFHPSRSVTWYELLWEGWNTDLFLSWPSQVIM